MNMPVQKVLQVQSMLHAKGLHNLTKTLSKISYSSREASRGTKP